MPNLLAHLGVGGVITRGVAGDVDPKWIYAGCLIPDLPWIVQRLAWNFQIKVDALDLRSYCMCQASFAGCLLLSAALAFLSTSPRRVFVLLALNSLIHLLLDACQTKWGSGVHILAPFSWHTWNFSLFWPESPITYALTLFGLAYVLVVWWRGTRQPIPLTIQSPRRISLAFLFLALYYIIPFVVIHGPYEADSHFVRTLAEVDQRPGRDVEFDRNRSCRIEKAQFIKIFTGEKLNVMGANWNHDATVSVRGTFLDEKTVIVKQSHLHQSDWRERASLVGLSLVFVSWFVPRKARW